MRLNRPFILASASPRRSHLLSQVGFEFTVHPAEIVEEIEIGESATELVTRLAATKAREVSTLFPEAIVLAADTIVVLDGEALGKPESPEIAIDMLSRLAGKTHTVHTAFALQVLNDDVQTVDLESTDVTMDTLPLDFLQQYVATGSPMDKAGSYGIQDMGAFLVNRIKGDFYTVMGLPLHGLYKRLTESFVDYIVQPDIQFESQ